MTIVERYSWLLARIEREKAKMVKLDKQIGLLMSARVGVEEAQARLYEIRNRMSQSCAVCKRPEFWEGHAMFNGRPVADHAFAYAPIEEAGPQGVEEDGNP